LSGKLSAFSIQRSAISLGLDSIFETMAAVARYRAIDQLLDGSIGPVICGFDLGRRPGCFRS
jgi:hypothetical protein